jgi:hypothetical protein
MDDFVITGPVMAFIKVSTAHKNAVGSIDKTIHEKDRVYPAGAHHPDHPQVAWVLEAGHTCRIGCGIAAPVAEEAEYPGFNLNSCHFANSLYCLQSLRSFHSLSLGCAVIWADRPSLGLAAVIKLLQRYHGSLL